MNVEREEHLTAAFVELTNSLVSDYDVVDLMDRLVIHSVHLARADEAGLLLTDQRGGLHVMASSNERTRLLELFQLQADEGPCLDCFNTGEPVDVPDLRTETQRWPQFAPAALDEGYAAVHAVPMSLRGEVVGALNLFSSTPHSFSVANRRIGRALADVATIALVHQRATQRRELVIEQLEGALSSRVVIEQAKGILAATGNLPVEQMFNRLRDYSRRNSTPLTIVARELTQGRLAPSEVLETSTRR